MRARGVAASLLLVSLGVGATAAPASADVATLQHDRAGRVHVKRAWGNISWDFDLIASTALDRGDAHVVVSIPVSAKGCSAYRTHERKTPGGAVIWFTGSMPARCQPSGTWRWRVLELRRGKVVDTTTLTVVVDR